MKLLKILATLLLLLVAALVVIPLVVLAGLFIWLKLTEEGDEESLELDEENL
jgi:cytochrome bd-type quinol oxidase subunit 2